MESLTIIRHVSTVGSATAGSIALHTIDTKVVYQRRWR
jgi:hypothetical protein